MDITFLLTGAEDFGTYAYTDYKIYDPQDEGHDIEESPTTLEYNGIPYPVYTDIDNSDYYIMLNGNGVNVMVKTSAIRPVQL